MLSRPQEKIAQWFLSRVEINVKRPFVSVEMVEFALLASLLLATFLSYSTILSLSPPVSTILAFLLVFILPGVLLLRLIGYIQCIFTARSLSLGFITSIGLLSFPCLIVMMWWNLRACTYFVFLLDLGLLVGFAVRMRDRRSKLQWNNVLHSYNPALLVILVLLLALLVYVALYNRNSGDDWSILALIRQHVFSDRIDFADPVLGTGFVQGRIMFHLTSFLEALVCQVSWVSPEIAVMVYMPPLLAFIGVIAFYSLCSGLMGSKNAALFATALQIIYLLVSQGFPGTLFNYFIICDKAIGVFILTPGILLLTYEFLSSPNVTTQLLLALAIWGLSVLHPIVLFLCCLSIASFLVMHFLRNRNRSTTFRVLLIGISILVGVPFPLFLRTQFLETSSYELSLDAPDVLIDHRISLHENRLLFFSERSYMADPALILENPIRTIAFALVPFLAIHVWKQKDAMSKFLLSNLLFPALLLYNPVTAPLLGKFLTPFQIFRVSWLFPDVLVIAFLGYRVVNFISKQLYGKWKVLFQTGMLSMAVATVMVVHWNSIKPIFHITGSPIDSVYPYRSQGIVEYLRTYAPHHPVVLASDRLNVILPGLSGVYVVETAGARTANFFAPSEVSKAVERIEAVQYFEQAAVFSERLKDIIEEYEVEFIIVPSGNLLTSQLTWLSAFSLRYQDSRYSLFQVSDLFYRALHLYPDVPFYQYINLWSTDLCELRIYDFSSCLAQGQMQRIDSTRVRVDVFYLPDRVLPVLFEHPPSSVQCPPLLIPNNAALKFSIALSPEVWTVGKGDGVQFDVYLEDDEGTFQVFSKYVDPKNDSSRRRWTDCEIDLSDWAGRTATFTFATGPGPQGDNRYDWAGWGEPRLVLPAYYTFLGQLSQANYIVQPNYIRRDWLEIEGDVRDVLFQHPTTRIVYNDIEILRSSTLNFGIGIDPQVWSADRGDGVDFEILVQDTSSHQMRVFEQYIDPKNNSTDRHWFDVQVDLSQFAGQTVDVHFITNPGPANNSDYDWAVWSNPVLVAAPERTDDELTKLCGGQDQQNR